LQPHVVAHIAEGLIVEDKCGDPALEVSSGGDSRRTPNGDLRCSSADPYGNHTRGHWEIQADRTESSLDFQPGEIEATQFGCDLRCPALDRDLPRDGGVECDLRCTLLPTKTP